VYEKFPTHLSGERAGVVRRPVKQGQRNGLRAGMMDFRVEGCRWLLLSMVLMLTQACAYQYVDADGNQRVMGLVNVAIDTDENCSAPRKVTVSTLGISAVNLPSHGGVSVGYSRNSSLFLPDDQLVIIGAEDE
jgi:hypothetical protein